MTMAPPKINEQALISHHGGTYGYDALVGKESWKKLHPAIQKRFSEKVHQSVTYKGVMSEVYLSFAGKIFAQVCRIIGTPLALYEGKDVPMEVNVYPNDKLKGMTWERNYQYENRPSNKVISTKCVQVDGKLVEVVGFGFGMALKVYEKDRTLFFESENFFWELGNLKLRIPDWLTPGKTIVSQKAIDDELFEFKLEVRHSVLGRVFYQVGVFKAMATDKLHGRGELL